MNKRGFLRTLEAVIAVVIVFLFIYYAGKSSGDKDARYVQGIRSLQESVLDEISKNDDFRECIVSTSNDDTDGNDIRDIVEIGEGGRCKEIDTFIKDSLPTRFKERYAFNVCNPLDLGSCSLPGNIKGGEVYTSAVVISSSLNNGKYNPRILRMWLF
ncbi:hypothetical protein HYV89_00025 [Candidatus Woesearchaeota archaeon]|nr:hypothetical protein [Candidatus Woesearchaeota archaeon]